MVAFLETTKDAADAIREQIGKVLPGRLMGLVGSDVNKVSRRAKAFVKLFALLACRVFLSRKLAFQHAHLNCRPARP